MSGIACPQCFNKTRARGSRRFGQTLRRYRKCTGCGLNFTTREEVITDDPAPMAQRAALKDLDTRYLALGIAGRATVRQLITALEEAEQRGARHEAAAIAAENTTPLDDAHEERADA